MVSVGGKIEAGSLEFSLEESKRIKGDLTN
jgi:hypothetical protein